MRLLLLCLLPLCLLCVAGCSSPEPEDVRSARVEQGRIERVVVATGTIEPSREVEVRPRIAGIIERVHVDAGDRVEQGQLLVEIERELLASQVAEARAAVREALVERRYAEIDLKRAQEMVESGATSSQKHDEASARHERAQARVAGARAKLSTLNTQLSYAEVRSPLSGRVLDVPIEEGSAVSPVTAVTGGTLLLSLAATDRLHLEGLVDENEVARLAIDQPARIRTEAFGDQIFEGRLREIAPLGQRVQNVTYFEVEVELTDERAELLRPRMSGDAEIVAEVFENALFVPESALRYRGDEIFVETRNGDAGEEADWQERSVGLGVVDGDRVQILEGIEAGEEIRLH